MAAALTTDDDDLIVLSDEEQQPQKHQLLEVRGGGNESDVSSPTPPLHHHPSKKPRLTPLPCDSPPPVPVLILDDEITPQRLSSIVVPETPLSSSVVIVKCTTNPGSYSDKISGDGVVLAIRNGDLAGTTMQKYIFTVLLSSPEDDNVLFDVSHMGDAGMDRLICLESDNESDNVKEKGRDKENKISGTYSSQGNEIRHTLTPVESTLSAGISRYYDSAEIIQYDLCSSSFVNDTYQPEAVDSVDKGIFDMELMDDELYHERVADVNVQKKDADQQMDEIPNMELQAKGKRDKNGTNRGTKNKLTEEEKKRIMEEKKQNKEQEKLQKAIMKAEAAEMKKIQKEKQKWENGKFALKSIVAQIDAKVVETSIGGHLLSRLTEKGLTFRIKSNPVERSIVWSMTVPEHISELASGPDISYVSLVFEAEEFCNLVSSGSLFKHVQSIQSLYPSHTICYITNRLMAYINKREQELYKGPINDDCLMRPPVEEVLAKLSTHFDGVHSRLCIDEAEVAEHVVGLTCSLAACLYRKRLTKLSVNANGSNIPKGTVDMTLLKNNCWLKALMAIPKVQPRFAIAIWKKYPSMKSLLKVYMDPGKPVHEKEFLLKDLTTEGLVADDRRLGEVCSKRVYRVLMAQSGNIKTDDIEDGADFFGNPSLSRS